MLRFFALNQLIEQGTRSYGGMSEKSASPTMNNGTGRRFILTTDIRRQIKSDGAMDMST